MLVLQQNAWRERERERVVVVVVVVNPSLLLVRFVGQNCRYFNGQMLLGVHWSPMINLSKDHVTN